MTQTNLEAIGVSSGLFRACQLETYCSSGTTSDQAKRLAMMTKAQEIVMSEAPWVFIAFPGYHFARRANLKGFTYYTSNNIRFQDFSREG